MERSFFLIIKKCDKVSVRGGQVKFMVLFRVYKVKDSLINFYRLNAYYLLTKTALGVKVVKCINRSNILAAPMESTFR